MACCRRARWRGRPRHRSRSSGHVEHARGQRDDLLAHVVRRRCSADEPALIACRLAKAPTPCEIAAVSPAVITMSSRRQPTRSATICDRVVLVPCPCAGGAGRDRDLPVGEHAHRDALERPEPRAFHVVADADAEIAALGARVALARAEALRSRESASARVWLFGKSPLRIDQRLAVAERQARPSTASAPGRIMLRRAHLGADRARAHAPRGPSAAPWRTPPAAGRRLAPPWSARGW